MISVQAFSQNGVSRLVDNQFSIPGTKPSSVQRDSKDFLDSMNITHSSCLPVVWQSCNFPLELLLLWKGAFYALIYLM